MERPPLTPARRTRRSRAELKQETRDALIEAGLVTFSRDGYHGAALEVIANDAGFSKGAIYSNFSGKAGLFLAVLDYNLSALRGEGWDPLTPPGGPAGEPQGDAAEETPGTSRDEGTGEPAPGGGPGPAGGEQEAEQLVRGFGLATLEFITTAARDDTLMPALRSRVHLLLEAYGRVATAHRAHDEELAVDEIAQLMVALDQGSSVLALSGVASVDGSLMRQGLRRLLGDPGDSADGPAQRPGRASLLPTVAQVQRLIRDNPQGQGPPETAP